MSSFWSGNQGAERSSAFFQSHSDQGSWVFHLVTSLFEKRFRFLPFVLETQSQSSTQALAGHGMYRALIWAE